MSKAEDILPDVGDEFLAKNAELFGRAFAGLNQVFGTEGPIRILSEEEAMTVAVGVRPADGADEADVDCVLLEPNQESVRDCLDTLFEEH